MSGYGGHRSGAGRKSTIPFNANTNHKLNTFFVTSRWYIIENFDKTSSKHEG